VDRDGAPVTLPDTGRTVTVLHAHGAPSIALLHDSAALGDPDVAEAVTAAIQFVVERQRLASQPASPPVDFARLPTGHLTHLLTDIEGSTGLLTQLTDRYADVLASVRRIIRQEVSRAGGFEVDARADETYAVFEDAASAVGAAAAIQRGLAAARWPDGLDVRVRVGVHSGDVVLSESGYVGLSLNTAARVMAAGHGGQILTTPATMAAAAKGLVGNIGFRSLGAHRLAGLAEPVELLQVDAEGLGDEFPRLRVPAAESAP
jgi:class 3 adenylate cyclase